MFKVLLTRVAAVGMSISPQCEVTLAFLIPILIVALAGCARFQDSYQFGDITLSLGDAVFAYCNDVPDIPKDVALKAIRAHLPFYPKDGICG